MTVAGGHRWEVPKHFRCLKAMGIAFNEFNEISKPAMMTFQWEGGLSAKSQQGLSGG